MKKRLSILLLSLAATVIALAATTENTPATSYFIDIHEFGPGNVTASAVADAHRHDLTVQQKHGVRFIKYWVDEENGRVYCLSSAASAASIANAHREAHGLLPASILHVSGGNEVALTEGAQLFLDIHEFGAGNVTAKAVAEAHEKDLQVQSRFGVRFINYWVDEANGKVLCLSEAPNAEAVRETHRHAHGLLPLQVVKVTQGE
ncbi:MAG: DUF4242 domain-containing protein [Nibricoccus sp.]